MVPMHWLPSHTKALQFEWKSAKREPFLCLCLFYVERTDRRKSQSVH